MGTLIRYRRSIISFLLINLLLLLTSFAAYAGPGNTVYFYNPETNINNFASLKAEFDKYLSDYGDFQFQPINDRHIFEKIIAKRRGDGVFMLSSWHYINLKKKFPIEAVLVGVSKGKTTHKKVLSTNKHAINLNSLKNKSISSSGSEEYTKSILIEMLGEGKENTVGSLRILTVPKDIDALMAVGFGVSDCSLTTEASLANLLVINRKQFKMMKILAESDKQLLPIIAVHEQSDRNVNLLLTIIEEMEMTSEGVEKLKMLGLDGWKEVGEEERVFLDK